MLQVWNVCRRNCIDFKHIPLELIKPRSEPLPENEVATVHTVYPTVAVYIPCYNEEVELVRDTVVGALGIDYPRELLRVHLCDDGQDPEKKKMIAKLSNRHDNVFYVTREEHKHAKAGNLNHALENTHSDLVITLDADFIPRPNIIQRLLPYYYVWNPDSGLYEFNETLAVVQTPQHFRNLSPHDSDPLDQRSLLFFEVIQHGKDWLNASTMVGTNNLISRSALERASYYPYYSITEDTAMSLRFHSLGYRTYYVNESLATGLATTTLRSNLRQRARWMKGDWQILFSKHGPFLVRGLSIIQRLLYLNMGLGRLFSFVFVFFDAASVALLLGGVTPLDVQYPIVFIMYLSGYIILSALAQFSLTAGGKGLRKSAAGSVVFETIFRYTTVTDKSNATGKPKAVPDGDGKDGDSNGSESEGDEDFSFSNLSSSVDNGHATPESVSDLEGLSVPSEHSAEVVVDLKNSEQVEPSGCCGKKPKKTREHRRLRRKEVLHNLKRIWFNIFTVTALIFSIVWGLVNPRFVPDGYGYWIHRFEPLAPLASHFYFLPALRFGVDADGRQAWEM
ncbi:CesA-like Cellulose synthase (UDP-forming) family GT2 [Gracilaria domingensis]|nr:CesA-like Cellulose synthase (UDP-forming) family GT2 [Gracilaria domingensis]